MIPVRAWARALLCLSLIGCSSRTTTGPRATVSGRVVVRAYVVDETGTVLDSTDYASVSGIRVRLMADSVVMDSANTVNGAFTFAHWTAGSRNAVGCVRGFPVDTTGPVTLGSSSASFPEPLILGTYGPIRVYPNPTIGADRVLFAVDTVRTGRVLVTTMSGTLVRTLASQEFVAGVHEILWDGTTDAGGAAPTATYWVVLDLRSGVVPVARAASPASALDVPVPGTLPVPPPVSCAVIVRQ
jgi:hypothetical protein